ncbi:hypothetical protein PTKIN_Ptkin09bG0259300 [Pterospermum kingtungense]
MASKVGCSLKIFEAKANDASPTTAAAAAAEAAAGGVIEVRIKLRYQLRIKAYGVEVLADDITTPEFITPFAMPLAFLMPELSETHVSNMLVSLNIDAKVREFSTPMIAKFAVDVAKRRGAAVSGFITVAQLSITKIDFIREEEFDRISRTLKQEDIGSKQR